MDIRRIAAAACTVLFLLSPAVTQADLMRLFELDGDFVFEEDLFSLEMVDIDLDGNSDIVTRTETGGVISFHRVDMTGAVTHTYTLPADRTGAWVYMTGDIDPTRPGRELVIHTEAGAGPYSTVVASLLQGVMVAEIPDARAKFVADYDGNGRDELILDNAVTQVFEVWGYATGAAVPDPVVSPLDGTVRAVPNPFNPRTEIWFTLAERQEVAVAIFDVRGRRIHAAELGVLEAGEHAYDWTALADDRAELPAGQYLCTVVAGGRAVTGKLLLVK